MSWGPGRASDQICSCSSGGNLGNKVKTFSAGCSCKDISFESTREQMAFHPKEIHVEVVPEEWYIYALN